MRLRQSLLLASTVAVLTACATDPVVDAGVRCHKQCVTHEDGYQWAQSGTLADPKQCEGYSSEFTRGCKDAVNDFSQMRPYSKGL